MPIKSKTVQLFKPILCANGADADADAVTAIILVFVILHDNSHISFVSSHISYFLGIK